MGVEEKEEEREEEREDRAQNTERQPPSVLCSSLDDMALLQCAGILGRALRSRGATALVGGQATKFSPTPAVAADPRRPLHFDVEDNSKVDHMFKRLNRKLNMEGVLLEKRIRARHTKKSDQKIIDQRRTAKRLARKAIGRRINWIMKRRERGF